MRQRKSKIILFYFFLLIIISSITNISLNNLKFNEVKNVKVSGLSESNNQIIIEKIYNLNLSNILLINKNEIINSINSNSLVEKYEVTKLYPSTIQIKINKTEFLAKINKNGKTFLVGSNGKLIPNDTKINNLPFIFGKPEINEFLKFKKIIDKSQLSYHEIKSFYFFPSMRWDLRLKNNILLKLPKNFTEASLVNANEFIKNFNFDKFTVIDFRVNNQIIVNE
tara:strand:- start:3656 stop:4327 length:672 start_codon:yes stop_codon:yes gene_type:complete